MEHEHGTPSCDCHTCDCCDDYIEAGEEQRIGDDLIYCQPCYDDHTTRCSDCGDVVDAEQSISINGNDICHDCVDQSYHICGGCDGFVHCDYARFCDHCEEDYCDDCYSHHRHRDIHDYGYKPEPNFLGDGDYHFGVELEIDGAGCNSDNVQHLLQYSNSEDLFYIKEDSSLNDGMEIVSHPATMDFHLNRFPWHDIIREAREMGYTSHKGGTCGLHVHISKTAFGSTNVQRDAAYSRLIILFWKHWDELKNFSRRSNDSLQHWAKSNYTATEYSEDQLELAVNTAKYDRYYAINLSNYDTVELRLWRGTLNENTFRATLQLTNRLVDIARTWSITDILTRTWDEVITSEYPEINQYMEERTHVLNRSEA